MTASQLPEPPTCACGKVRYQSKRHAKAAIRRFQGRVGRLHPYKCAGGFWHVGHMPPNLTAGQVARREFVDKVVER